MIGLLKGTLISITTPSILVEVSGVGYEVDLPMSDCAEVPEIGGVITLYTHLIIREDAHLLYGFLSLDSRNCFRQLIKVSGVGPKIALALLSTLTVDDIHLAIFNADVNILTKTPGIGKKVAERLLLELKGKNIVGIKSSSDLLPNNKKYSIQLDIANALFSLGYGDKETNQVIKQLPEDIVDLIFGIKEALKLLNKHRSL